MAKGYKVIVEQGRTSSYALGTRTHYYNSNAVFNYPVKEPVKRRKGWGPFAVFTNLKDAESFARAHSPWQKITFYLKVVACDYEPSRDRKLWGCDKAGNRYTTERRWWAMPPGTDFADEVTCLE